MEIHSNRREFMRRATAIGIGSAAAPFFFPREADAQNPPPPEPANTTWTTMIVSSGEPGDPLVVSGSVFAPEGEHAVAGVLVYAYNTDKNGYYSPDGSVRHPRLKGYMKTDAEGRFELHTIVPGRYPGMHIPAHVHFNLWGAGYPVQWTDDLRFEGDSYLTEEMKQESKEREKFATIQPLTRDSTGIYRCEINLRLKDKSNFPGH